MEWITDNWKFIAIGVAVVIVLALIAFLVVIIPTENMFES